MVTATTTMRPVTWRPHLPPMFRRHPDAADKWRGETFARRTLWRRRRGHVPATRDWAIRALDRLTRPSPEKIPPDKIQDILLCLTEFVTNALRHSERGRITVRLRYTGHGSIVVEVTDPGSVTRPVVKNVDLESIFKNPDPDAESGGRGLMLVATYADDWGFRELDRGRRRREGHRGRRRIWCEVEYR